MKKLGFFIVVASFVLASCKSQQKVSQLDEPEEDYPQEMVRDEVPMDDTQDKMNQSEEASSPISQPTPPKLSKEQQLNSYLSGISSASSTNGANQTISQAMSMFSSPDATVLLIFYEANGKASYDEPTTISKYLNYLKDTNSKPATVEEMVLDPNGKIKELILKK